MKKIVLIATVILGSVNSHAADFSEILPPLPAGANPEKIWSEYCVGNRNSAEIPWPNYKNEEVLSAVKKLTMISPYSFYFYSGPLYAYNLRNGKELVDPPADFPSVPEVKNGRKNAHAFMTLLCGEFRDRPTLIKEKIRWVNRMYTLPVAPQKSINIKHELWSQVSAYSYKSYIENSQIIFNSKMAAARDFDIKIGKYNEDVPVEPFTVCETKFIFKKYVETNSKFKFDDLAKYKSEYRKFKARCNPEDLDYIYDFRGDSNFKPNSPESNGMIWYSSTITNNCTRTKDGQYVLKAASKEKITDASICEKYAKNPFAYRWSAARAGLATWMLRDQKHDETFSAEGENVYIVPSLDPTSGPFGFKMPVKGEFYLDGVNKNEKGEYVSWDDNGNQVVLPPEQVQLLEKKIAEAKAQYDKRKEEANVVYHDFVKNWEAQKAEFWRRPDLGFNQLTGLGTRKVNKEFAYERLRDAVNRHTDWYSSGYEDGFGILREQAYSPFVASSYEMSASDGFTAPGVTIQSPADGCKHWMFVFKLKKDKWYNTQSVQDKKKIDFNYHWIDETSFGTNHLADSEKAFDRLGTALEGEMDVILYLHKLKTNGEVFEQCGYEQMGLQQ